MRVNNRFQNRVSRMIVPCKKSLLASSLGLLALATAACGPVDHGENQSVVKWGMHSYGLRANLLNLLPGQSVEVCAQTNEQLNAAVTAIEKWATVINRWGKFSVKPCGSRSNLVITVQGSSVVGQNQFTANPGRILVMGSASGDFLQAILLHEIGHSWGLCDQYMDAGSASCSSTRSPSQNNNEVMGATSANKLQLTEGDKVGIRTVANMDSPANNAWRNHLRMRP